MLVATLFSAFIVVINAQGFQDCALIVTSPPTSSSNPFRAFRGQFQEQRTCITYQAVDSAFTAAQTKLGFNQSQGRMRANVNKVGELGTVIHETSKILERRYGLSTDAVAKGLPLIDTKRTSISQHCPAFLMTPRCQLQRYRSITGQCNNLENPHWGAAMNSHQRFLSADYADGVALPRESSSGLPLPNARLLSSNMHKDEGYHDHAVTLLLVAWGQFIDHDITRAAETKDEITRKTPKCCQGGREAQNPNCLPIQISNADPFYRNFDQRCMNFVRHQAGLRPDCKLGPREQFNEISSFLDGGTIYSNQPGLLHELRLNKGGLMKTLPVFENQNLRDLMPLKLEEPDEGCLRPDKDVFCFLGGDVRSNENMILTMMHTIFVREHNRLAGQLAEINPHWDDETIFQEARHINAAQIQHITFNEFLPMVLGREVMHSHDLVLLKNEYFEGYDKTVNPSAASAFTTSAFRFGHSLLPTYIERWSKTHRFLGRQKLSGLFFQPYDLYKAGWADTYLMGLVNQVAQANDYSLSKEVTNHLFQEPGKDYGLDLASLNIQRGREFGTPSYNRWREWCGLSVMTSWEDLLEVMANNSVKGYSEMYESPEDIDLWTAGISERPLPGSMVGPTFACIIGKQFHNFRFGDRFWYEGSGWPSSFTIEQLNEIRKVKLSSIFCDNSDDINNMQVYAMVLPDHEINPRVPCKSGVLPRIDLNQWRDASFHSAPPKPSLSSHRFGKK